MKKKQEGMQLKLFELRSMQKRTKNILRARAVAAGARVVVVVAGVEAGAGVGVRAVVIVKAIMMGIQSSLFKWLNLVIVLHYATRIGGEY